MAFDDFMAFWTSVGHSFQTGNTDEALRRSVAFFSEGQQTFEGLPNGDRRQMMENLAEWKALTTSRDAFPSIDRMQVQRIQIPVLMMCGEKTLLIHRLVNAELERLLKGNPRAKRITIAGATHDMWTEQPGVCRMAAFEFLGVQ